MPEFNKKHIAIWALGMCGGANCYVDLTRIAVFAFEHYPAFFSLTGYNNKYPDIDAVRTALSHSKKDLALIEQDQTASNPPRPIRKFRLNSDGKAWFSKHRDEIEKNASKSQIVEKKLSHGRTQLKDVRRTICSRIHALESFRGGDSTIHDFFSVFSISMSTPVETFEKKKNQVLTALETTSEHDFALALCEKFGHNYREYDFGSESDEK